MIRTIKKTLNFFRNISLTLSENITIKKSRLSERLKFRDKRRKKIYKAVSFTEEQKKSIKQFYKKYYGKSIPLKWHKHYYAFTSNFDFKILPELIYIPEFEYFMNFHHDYQTVFSDKYILSRLAKDICKTPKNIVIKTKGIYLDPISNTQLTINDAIKLLDGEIFMKPTTDSNSGHGCMLLNLCNGIDITTNKKIESILQESPIDCAFQEKIQCSPSVSRLNPSSVNTFRIITYRWKDQIYHGPIIMRIGREGHFLDNAHAGGIFIGIDDSGSLQSTAFTEFCEKFTEHPDSKIVFDKYHINNFPKVIEAAHKMHQMFPEIGCVNWDFTINNNEEPILIEGNTLSGSVWLSEMAWGKGLLGDNTSEILSWLHLMKKSSHKKRLQYCFGYAPSKS